MADYAMDPVPEMTRERQKASFPLKPLSALIWGGEARLASRIKAQDFVSRDRGFAANRRRRWITQGKTENLDWSLEAVHHFVELLASGALDDFTVEERMIVYEIGVGYSASFLHFVMFLPVLRGLGSDAQLDRWLADAEGLNIWGCYAQTELGHGSNVQGLETRAVFDHDADEFVITSPTLTSMKFWPGALGTVATHAVLHARLIVPNEDGTETDHGVHGFMVQLRSLDDHSHMPGVVTYEIGRRMGTDWSDNGALVADGIRIPRFNLLSRYTQLSRDGEYTSQPATSKLAYVTMMKVRSLIVHHSAVYTSRVMTIVIRYLAVRRQFTKSAMEGNPDAAGETETQVLDYQAVQARLFPVLAQTYAMFFTANAMDAVFDRFLENIEAGTLDESEMKTVHATLSGLKAVTTEMASEGMETARRACGGVGFLASTALPEIVTSVLANVTVEGDNYMLAQQTSKYLLKVAQKVAGGAPAGTGVEYLNNVFTYQDERSPAASVADIGKPAIYRAAFAHRATRLVSQAAMALQRHLSEGLQFAEAYNRIQWRAIRMAHAHTLLAMVDAFVAGVAASPADLQPVLSTLCELFALSTIEADLGAFVEDGYFSGSQAQFLHTRVRELYDELRPNAVGLVDAFNHSDGFLNSTIGCADGHAYERVVETMMAHPINNRPVIEAYHTHIRPILKTNIGSRL